MLGLSFLLRRMAERGVGEGKIVEMGEVTYWEAFLGLKDDSAEISMTVFSDLVLHMV